MKNKIVLIILLVQLSSLLTAQALPFTQNEDQEQHYPFDTAPISSITSSNNYLGNHAPETIVDGDLNSWFSIIPGSEKAWVTFRFLEPVHLEQLLLQGNLPDQALLYLTTEINERPLTLPTGLAPGPWNTHIMDLSRDSIYSDNLTLYIEGENLLDFRLEEIFFQTAGDEKSLSTIRILPSTLENQIAYLNGDYLLVDGKAGTLWNNIFTRFPGNITPHRLNEDRERVEFEISTPAEMEFVKLYLSDRAFGKVTLEIQYKDGDNLYWKAIEEIDLAKKQGWKKISLREQGILYKIALSWGDSQRPWLRRECGGIGEIELWSRSEPITSEIQNILYPVRPYNENTILFDYESPIGISNQLLLSQQGDSLPLISLNGRALEKHIDLQNIRTLAYPGFNLWEIPLPEYLLKKENNLLSLKENTESQLFSVHLEQKKDTDILLSERSLSDGRKFSGSDVFENPLLLQIPEADIEIEEILIYYQNQMPKDLSINLGESSQFLDWEVLNDGILLYRGRAEIDSLKIRYPGDIQEVELRGSPMEPKEPWVRILLPEKGILFQPKNQNSIVLGITDSPEGEITINGIPALKRDNFFWVELKDLGLWKLGKFDLEAKVTLPNGVEGIHRREIDIELWNNLFVLDQELELYITGESSFLLSGKVHGNRTDLFIGDKQIALTPSGNFKYNVDLIEGLNSLTLNLFDKNGSICLQTENLQVYRQSQEPYLKILSPQNGSSTNDDSVTIEGQASPWALDRIEINGQTALVQGSKFYLHQIPLLEEENIIHVQSFYTTGGSSESEIIINRDTTAPVISGVEPNEDFLTHRSTVNISGRVEDDSELTVFINGKIAPLQGRFFSLLYALPHEGENNINISARDISGNWSYYPVFTVTCDNSGPVPFSLFIDPSNWSQEQRPQIRFDTVDQGIGLSHFAISIDGNPFFTIESPFKLPFLRDGSIPIKVRAYDLFGQFTDAIGKAQVDTTPPPAAPCFTVIPGNERVILQWKEPSEDIIDFYRIGLIDSNREITISSAEGKPNDDGVLIFETSFENLETDRFYSFYIEAVDHVGLIGPRNYSSIKTSQAEVLIKSHGISQLKYDGLTLSIPNEAVPENIDRIILRELENPTTLDDSINPIASPVYSFSVITASGEEENHIQFNSSITGQIEYEDNENQQESRLALYHYNQNLNRWFKEKSFALDIEKNILYFEIDHFSDYNMQESISEGIDAQEWNSLEFPINGERTIHSSLNVSPQSGSSTASMTEIVLPGYNGLDLVLRRVYSSAQAKTDSSVLPVNGKAIPQLLEKQLEPVSWTNPQNKEINELIDSAFQDSNFWSDKNYNWQEKIYQRCIRNNPEYIWALGQGWRLDLPYCRYSESDIVVHLTDGVALYSSQMIKTEEGNNITYEDRVQGKGTIAVESTSVYLTATTPDGRIYTFYKDGFIHSISDTYDNSIKFYYKDNRIDTIIDSKFREVHFEYYDQKGTERYMPLIKGFAVYQWNEYKQYEDPFSQAEFSVQYQYDTDKRYSSGIPLLMGSIDVGGRHWEYGYEHHYLEDFLPYGDSYTGGGYQNGFVFPLTTLSGPGIGTQNIEYYKDFYVNRNNLFDSLGYLGLRKNWHSLQLAVKTLQDLNDNGNIQRERSYKYQFNNSGNSVSTVIEDSRRREVYRFITRKFEILEENKLKPDEFTLTLESEHKIYSRFEDQYNLQEKKHTSYSEELGLPTKEHYFFGRENCYITTEYEYDLWGNPVKISTEEKDESITHYMTQYNWYNNGNDHPDITITPSPLENSTLDNRIHDRLLRTVSSYDSIGMINYSPLDQRESVFSYNSQGSLTASASYAGNNSQGANWITNLYEYNRNGELIEHTDPLGQVREIKYFSQFAYSQQNVDRVFTIEKQIETPEGTKYDRKTISYQHPLTGWIIREEQWGYVNQLGQPIEEENPVYSFPLTRLMERDNLGRITQLQLPANKIEPQGPLTQIFYDDNLMTVKVIDPVLHMQSYQFNLRGEIISLKKFENESEEELLQHLSMIQDYYGNISDIQIHKESGNIERLSYQYDGLGRRLLETYLEEEQRYFVNYRYAQNEISRTDELGNKRVTRLNARGNVISQKEYNQRGTLLREKRFIYNARGELAAEWDGEGKVTFFHYDRQGNRIKTISPEVSVFYNGTSFTAALEQESQYNHNGQVTEERLTAGDNEYSHIYYSYDQLGRLETESQSYLSYNDNFTDFLTQENQPTAVIHHYYDCLDRKISTVDPRGNTWNSVYNNRGEIIEEHSPSGAITHNLYDLKDRLTHIEDPLGNFVHYQYDGLDRLVRGFLPERVDETSNRTVRFSYDREGNLLSRIDPDGSTTAFTYSEQNRVLTETKRNNSNPLLATKSYTTQFSYNPLGLLESKTPPGLDTITYEYDDLNRLIKETQGEGVILQYDYDLNNNLKWDENGRGYRNYHHYDALNRLIQTIDRSGYEWKYEYDALGYLTRSTDPETRQREYLYDQRGGLIREKDGRGLFTYYQYDLNGNLKRRLDPRGTHLLYNYRSDNLPINVSYSNSTMGQPSNHQLEYTYDLRGNIISGTDTNSSGESIYTYYNQDSSGDYSPDPMGLITRQKTINYDGRTISDVSYSYDSMDRIKSIQNGLYENVNYFYNRLNQLNKISSGQGDQELIFLSNCEYNLQGTLSSYILDNGIEAIRNYDSRSRLDSLSYNLNETNLKSYQYNYDRADNLIVENDNTYGYDPRDMLASAFLSEEKVKKTEEDLENLELNYVMNDVRGQLELEMQPGTDYNLDLGAQSFGADIFTPSLVNKITLHVVGNLIGENRISQDKIQIYTSMENQENHFDERVVESYQIIADGDNTKIVITLANQELVRYIKIHSRFNDRDIGDNADNSSSMIQLNREKPMTITRLVGGGRNQNYLYDSRGNRSNKSFYMGDEVVYPYSYYSNSDWLKSDGEYGFVYDNNGNLIQKGSVFTINNDAVTISINGEYWEYEYDLRNRLTSVKKLVHENLITLATYTYDINGYRVIKNRGSTEEFQYTFDLSGNMIEQKRIHDTSDDESIRYIFMGLTHIAQIDAEGTKFFGTNHLGSTTLLTDANGDILMDVETTPFGEQEDKSLFFTGKQWDEDAELYYFNSRWYSPDTGRFITEDPIKDGLLWFAYCANQPMNFVDPTGLWRTRAERQSDRQERRENREERRNPRQESSNNIQSTVESVSILPKPISPVNNPRITRPYDSQHGSKYHKGKDYISRDGDSSVVASEDGDIVFAGIDPRSDENSTFLPNADLTEQFTNNPLVNPGVSGVGYLVALMSQTGILSLDGHTIPTVVAGDSVNQGDMIGNYSNIGYCIGAHDHRVEAVVQDMYGGPVTDSSVVSRDMLKDILINSGYETSSGNYTFRSGDYYVTIIEPRPTKDIKW